MAVHRSRRPHQTPSPIPNHLVATAYEEHAEIGRLKAENKRLREDVAILKAAATFFAGELDPRNH